MEDIFQSYEINKISQFYDLEIKDQIDGSIDIENNISKPPFMEETDPILLKDNNHHYLCPKCGKFPFIEFTKVKSL